jgi:hypothetical protein
MRVSMVGYGMPRVGNPAFANYVDALRSAADGAPALTVTHIMHRRRFHLAVSLHRRQILC